MITWYDVLVQEQYRKEQLEKANHYRLLRQLSKRETMHFRPLLSRLGGQLVKWGCRLQAKYGTLAEVSKSVRCAKVLRRQYTTPNVCVSRK